MNDENPYSRPQSEVRPVADTAAPEVGEASRRPIGNGWVWYSAAWELFKPAWGLWLLTLLLLVVIMVALQLVPLIGGLVANLVAPVLMAGILQMARQAEAGRGVEIGELFAGFRERTGPLIAIGAINLVVTVLIIGLMMAPMIGAMSQADLGQMQGMSQEQMARQMFQGGAGLQAAFFVLLGLALLIPWLAAYWFSVPLVFLGGRGVGAALKQSFFACFRNILPFLWFGILYFLLAIVATIPLGLGWLILLPVLLLTYYTSFRDIFMGGLR